MSESESSQRMVFDPDQDPEEKRVVRQNYRALTKKIEEHQENPGELATDELLIQVERANQLFKKVKAPQEATLDSHLLVMATNIGAQKVRAMKSGSGTFDVDDFVSKLFEYMGGQRSIGGGEGESWFAKAHLKERDEEDEKGWCPKSNDSLKLLEGSLADDADAKEVPEVGPYLDWDRIGRKGMAKSRRVPITGFMLGPLSIEQKKRKIATRAKLEKKKEDLTRPQEIQEEDISRPENETSANVARAQLILEQEVGEPINIFRFFINPNGFAQSVENLFYLSFLLRDGKAVFDIKGGEPIIYPCEAPTQEQYDEGLKKRQMVFEFDRATWKRAIEVFNITEPIIPQRPKSEDEDRDKWYE